LNIRSVDSWQLNCPTPARQPGRTLRHEGTASGHVQATTDRERIQQCDQKPASTHTGDKQEYVSILRASFLIRHGSPPMCKANAGPCELFRQLLLADEQQRSEAYAEDCRCNHRYLPAGQIPQRLQNVRLRLPERHDASFAISVPASGHA
jgi:hypothetical protein